MTAFDSLFVWIVEGYKNICAIKYLSRNFRVIDTDLQKIKYLEISSNSLISDYDSKITTNFYRNESIMGFLCIANIAFEQKEKVPKFRYKIFLKYFSTAAYGSNKILKINNKNYYCYFAIALYLSDSKNRRKNYTTKGISHMDNN